MSYSTHLERTVATRCTARQAGKALQHPATNLAIGMAECRRAQHELIANTEQESGMMLVMTILLVLHAAAGSRLPWPPELPGQLAPSHQLPSHQVTCQVLGKYWETPSTLHTLGQPELLPNSLKPAGVDPIRDGWRLKRAHSVYHGPQK